MHYTTTVSKNTLSLCLLSRFEEILWSHLLLEKLILELCALRVAPIVLRGRVQLLVESWMHVVRCITVEKLTVELHEVCELVILACVFAHFVSLLLFLI